MSINIEYNSKEINKLIIENILKMLERRKLINNWELSLNELDNNNNNWDNHNYKILLLDNTIYNIYILNNTNTQLTTISVGTPLYDFLTNEINIHKIAIIKNITKKALKQIFNEYKNVEYFSENEMLEDIPSKMCIPEHQILIPEQKNELLTKFSEKDLSRIIVTEMMARYYNAKVGDIIRIVRSSDSGGNNIFYRRVYPGSIDIILP